MTLHVDIRKKLGDFTLQVSFSADSGVLGILGASGCGKSVTLKCIAGIETPDEGCISLDGETLFDSRKRINLTPQKRRVGYLFQNFALFPNMTVLENIMAGSLRGADSGRGQAATVESDRAAAVEIRRAAAVEIRQGQTADVKSGPGRAFAVESSRVSGLASAADGCPNWANAVNRHPKQTKADRLAQAQEMIALLRLTGLENRLPSQLSGGQQQRTALARILVNKPRLLLLDEPFSSLDSYLKWQLEMALADILDTFPGPSIFVSHNRREIRRLCRKACVLDRGRSEKVRPVAELFENPGTLSACLLSGCKNISPALRPASPGQDTDSWANRRHDADLADSRSLDGAPSSHEQDMYSKASRQQDAGSPANRGREAGSAANCGQDAGSEVSPKQDADSASDRRLTATAWGCQLEAAAFIPPDCRFVGVHAHSLELAGGPGPNTIPCRLIKRIEDTASIILILASPASPDAAGSAPDSLLRLELKKEHPEADALPDTLYVHIPPEALMLLR